MMRELVSMMKVNVDKVFMTVLTAQPVVAVLVNVVIPWNHLQ